jgi:hypothetical protein
MGFDFLFPLYLSLISSWSGLVPVLIFFLGVALAVLHSPACRCVIVGGGSVGGVASNIRRSVIVRLVVFVVIVVRAMNIVPGLGTVDARIPAAALLRSRRAHPLENVSEEQTRKKKKKKKKN